MDQHLEQFTFTIATCPPQLFNDVVHIQSPRQEIMSNSNFIQIPSPYLPPPLHMTPTIRITLTRNSRDSLASAIKHK